MSSKEKLIVITGSNGFIGRNLVRALLPKYRIVGLDLGESNSSEYETIHMDLESQLSVENAFDQLKDKYGTHIDSFIHLAAYRNSSLEEDLRYEQVNFNGTAKVVKTLESFEVKQFVFTSTMFVHEPCGLGEVIDENSPLKPAWSDPICKLKAEALVRSASTQMPVVVLRLAEIYDDFCSSAPLAQQIKAIFEHHLNSVVYPGDIGCGKSFLHINDLTEAFLSLIDLKQELPNESTLLLGEPNTFSYDYLQRALGRLIHYQEWQTYQVPRALAQSEVWIREKMSLFDEAFLKSWMLLVSEDHYALDISRAKDLLLWFPKQSLDRTLAKMIYAFKSDPSGWYGKHKLKLPAWLEKEEYETVRYQEA